MAKESQPRSPLAGVRRARHMGARADGETSTLRRAVLVGAPGDGMRRLVWSGSWPNESAARDAVERLDTLTVSAQIGELMGVLPDGNGDRLVLRGGLMSQSETSGRYWREAVWVGGAELPRFRSNLLRVLPAAPPVVSDDLLQIEMAPAANPSFITAADDRKRLDELRVQRGELKPQELESLLAAVLEVDHTLVTGATQSPRDIELMILLLPPSLRAYLTFHSFALSMPKPQVPRLVMTQVREDWLFPEAGVFGHRLPATVRCITTRARGIANDLISLLDSVERLIDAHERYESCADLRTSGPRSPLDEVETVVRFARLLGARENGEAGVGLRVLVAAAGHETSSADPSFPELLELFCSDFPAPEIGAAVVDLVRNGAVSFLAPLRVVEWFVERRVREPESFEAFRQPFATLSDSVMRHAHDEWTGRLRSLLSVVRPVPAPIDVPARPSIDSTHAVTKAPALVLPAGNERFAPAHAVPVRDGQFAPPAPEPSSTVSAGPGPSQVRSQTQSGPDPELPYVDVLEAENRRRVARRRRVAAFGVAVALGVSVSVLGFSAWTVLRTNGSEDAGPGDEPGSIAQQVVPEVSLPEARRQRTTTAAALQPAASEEVAIATTAGAVSERLLEARSAAASNEWARVVALLSEPLTDLNQQQSFSIDSLLARATLALAERLPAGVKERTALLAQAFDHADRALAGVPTFVTRADALRLMRAEACLGGLDCDRRMVLEDLVLVGRSVSAALSARARELLAGRARAEPTGVEQPVQRRPPPARG